MTGNNQGEVDGHIGRNSTLGMVSLAFTLATWSFGPALSSKVLTHPLVSSTFRMTVAALFHWSLAIVLRKRPSGDLLKRSLLPGALFCLNNVLFFAALQRSSVANTTLLVSLQPVVVLLLAKPLFGEVVKRWDVIWTSVALIGAAYAILGANAAGKAKRTTPMGAAFALAAMFVFTGYFLISKRENSHHERESPNPLTFMTAILTASAIASWPVLIIGGKLHEALHLTHRQASPLLLVAFVPSLGHLSMTFAHRHVDASLSSLILLAQPITSALAAWWLLSQRVVAAQIIGGIVVVGCIAMVTLGRRRASTDATAGKLQPA